MNKQIIAVMASTMLVASLRAQQPPVATAAPKPDTAKAAPAAPKKPTVAEKTKGNKKNEGLFALYQDTATGSVQMYVRKDQLEKEFIYQSFSISGPTTLFLNQSMHRATFVFKIKRAFDKLEFSIVNTALYYDKNNPVSKTADVDKPEAVFFSDKFSLEDSLGYLVSVDGLFLSEKLDPV